MIERRRFLRAAAVSTTGLVPLLAGCPDPGQTVLDEPTDAGAPGGSNGDGGDAAGGADGGATTTDPGGIREEPEYNGWFDDVDNYEGTAVYRRDTDEVEVEVGAEGNGGSKAFDPPAIAVEVGTTVTWLWTGDGGDHNVVAEGGSFDSGPPTAAAETTFSHRFDEPGVFRYYSEQSRGVGMKGAVTVYE